MFLDEALITVRGGAGGRGCVAWRREKFVPKGGPAGGDGGDGGGVWIVADANTDTLSAFASRKRFEAEHGEPGSGNERGGRNGEDLHLLVPPGTVVSEPELPTPRVLADLAAHGERVLVASGGRGGYGNAHFKSSVRQRPDFAELGQPAEERRILLELRLVADVGIIGFPNAGKSTLISVLSAARPKIADYPFTTLVPNLGVVNAGERSFVVCDIPGLIEGASEGKGLGHDFLRHVERCGVLLHLIDCSRALTPDGMLEIDRLAADYAAIRRELERYSATLGGKREIVVLSKADLAPERVDDAVRELQGLGIPVHAAISAATRAGTDPLVSALLPIVLEERERRGGAAEEAAGGELPVLNPGSSSDRMGAFRVEESGGAIRVTGKRIEQFASMTDFASRGAVERFRDVIDRIGLRREIARMRGGREIPVYIGPTRVDTHMS